MSLRDKSAVPRKKGSRENVSREAPRGGSMRKHGTSACVKSTLRRVNTSKETCGGKKGSFKKRASREQRPSKAIDDEDDSITAGTSSMSAHKRKRIENCDRPNEEQRSAINLWLKDQMSLGMAALISQYEALIRTKLPRALGEPGGRSTFDANMDRNRYQDVVCLEPSRVKLNDGRPGDYIHANWVKGEPMVNNFICTQGPKENTVIDFWRMVYQEKARHIFMLCCLYENGKQKCEKYWPVEEETSLTFGDFKITNHRVNKPDVHVVTTILVVEDKKTGGRLTTKHHNWIDWPDKSAPKSLLAVFRLLRAARLSCSEVSVVHCSAGIGRTGTFVAMEYVLCRLLELKYTSLVQCVQSVREMRMSCVQVDVQYLYLVAAIGKFAQNLHCLSPETEAKFKRFLVEYDKYVDLKACKEQSTKKPGHSVTNRKHQNQAVATPPKTDTETDTGKEKTRKSSRKKTDLTSKTCLDTTTTEDMESINKNKKQRATKQPSKEQVGVSKESGHKKKRKAASTSKESKPKGAKPDIQAHKKKLARIKKKQGTAEKTTKTEKDDGTHETKDETKTNDALVSAVGSPNGFERKGGQDMSTLPKGAKPEDFPRPEGAGTDFVLDMTTPPKEKTLETAQTRTHSPSGGMEIRGGRNVSTLPPGTKPEDFPRPEGAGTDFVLDLTPAKSGTSMDVKGGATMSTLPKGAKAEDFPRPEGAGTDFKLDLGPIKPGPIPNGVLGQKPKTGTDSLQGRDVPLEALKPVDPKPAKPKVLNDLDNKKKDQEKDIVSGYCIL